MRIVRLCLPMLLSATIAAAQGPVVHATLSPTTGIIVGQPVRLTVEILAPNYFTGSPGFPEFELENAIVVLPQDRPQNTNAQIAGKTYAGIVETYTIYPQQPGEFHLPPAQITVPYADAPPKTTEAHVSLPTLTFHADIPAAAQNLNYFLPTTQLTIQQKWSSPLKNMKAGDTLERTITVTATKMQAMLIPPLPMEAPDGIRVYQEEPTVQDQKTDRGEFIFGRRTQSAKYFIQKEGDYTLPAIELRWWNLSSNRLVTATLPAVHFIAAANPNYVAEIPPEPEPVVVVQAKPVNWWTRYKKVLWRIFPISVAVLLLGWISLRYLPRLRRVLQANSLQRKNSEKTYFRNLQHACQRHDQTKTYEWLLRWIDKLRPRTSLEEFLSSANDPELSGAVNDLGVQLFAKTQNAQWNGEKLAHLLKRHRLSQTDLGPRHQHLKGLNP